MFSNHCLAGWIRSEVWPERAQKSQTGSIGNAVERLRALQLSRNTLIGAIGFVRRAIASADYPPSLPNGFVWRERLLRSGNLPRESSPFQFTKRVRLAKGDRRDSRLRPIGRDVFVVEIAKEPIAMMRV